VSLRLAQRAVLLVCLCLAGCSGLFQSRAKPEQIYYLRAPAASTAAPSAAIPLSLRLVRPLADPGLDTAHIMLVQADHRMNFYSGSRWPAPAPELIEALAVQTLRASGEWASVEDSTSPFPSDYLLQVHVRRFDADYTVGGSAPVARVVLDCTLGRRQGREVLSTFTVAGEAAAPANHLSQVVAAFEQATGTALGALAQQAAQVARGDVQRAAQNEDKAPASGSR
jgi:cholesterol transport system auxiliary component